MAKIEMLNYDVLREIFLYLNIYDRVRMGLVCKKWHNVVEIMMGSIRKMYFYVTKDDKSGRFSKIYRDLLQISTNNPRDLKKPWKKYGNNLNEIQIVYLSYKTMLPKFYKLLAKSTQLKYARFKCSKLETLRLLLEFLPTENLENLSVHLLESEYRVYLPEWNHLMGNILSKTPKLKALELNYLPISELSSIGGMGTLETLFIQTTDLPRLNFDINELRNLKTLSLFCPGYNIPDITKLMKKCRKIHTLRIISMCRLPEDTMNEMISLPNLRRLHLFKTSNSCDWDKFSNLEEIRISHNECYPKSRDQIISFLQRSKNLKYFDLHSWRHRDFNRVIRKIIRDIGFEYNEHRREAWIDFPGMSK
ncbi:hypothetical protein PV328_005804 [Microctonus aethiopoides]|uniref:F-box domain-containing protein n=1 Tax=Microctonus aethiopoides TaxID=144406 RepID=A0AA39KSP2_9HYME|nr:hypothetical protein PV328_005804 [Microctonus aethiopoides]